MTRREAFECIQGMVPAEHCGWAWHERGAVSPYRVGFHDYGGYRTIVGSGSSYESAWEDAIYCCFLDALDAILEDRDA